MCTVTFIPHKGKIFLASNRDEKHTRAKALSPVVYSTPSGSILFPKDPDAGGAWIVLHESGNAVVLLNGGIHPHIPNLPYDKSRGIVVLELVSALSPAEAFRVMILSNIEPFTVVMWDHEKLWEGIWDGNNKHISRKDETKPHIWSSVTLYDESVKLLREQWFSDWLLKNPGMVMEEIFHFHQFTGEGDLENDLLINRDGQLYTVSITGIEISNKKGTMRYLDLLQNRLYFSDLTLSPFKQAHQ